MNWASIGKNVQAMGRRRQRIGMISRGMGMKRMSTEKKESYKEKY